MPSVSIRYLYHSGFAVETASHLFIFDYYLDTPRGCGPDQGVVSPSMLQGRDVVVFVSHSHGDHYNPAIFQWRKGNPQIRYILADEIATKEDVLSVKAGKTYPLGGLEVRTLDSTDLGVAFLVKADGLCLYHAGDLNWWHWNDEPEEANRAMARRYQQQIDSLKGESIDIAFIPVDPRQEENALLGLDYFMKQVGALDRPHALWVQWFHLRPHRSRSPHSLLSGSYFADFPPGPAFPAFPSLNQTTIRHGL
ncbi:MAG: MBL fold metallo-hydrolase [Anaeromassilibacillus sp.]